MQQVSHSDLERLSSMQSFFHHVTAPLKNSILPKRMLMSRLKKSQSPLIHEFFNRPGGWRAMEIIYANNEPVDLLDRIVMRSHPVVIDARNRRRIVVRTLREWVDERSDTPKINLLGVGTGPGRQMLDAVAGRSPESVQLYCVDLDDAAFELGKKVAAESGYEYAVQFIHGDARQIGQHLGEEQIDLFVLIGIPEYLSDEQVVDLIQALTAVMKPTGRILTHGFLDPYRSLPFMKRIFGVEIIPRTGPQLGKLLENCGLDWEETERTPAGTYPMISAWMRS